jgi:hypothetical protein
MNTETPVDSISQDDDATRECKRKQLMTHLVQKIAEFGKEADKHKRMYRGMRYGLFILSGFSALLAGMAAANISPFLDGNSINLLIIFISSLSGVITSIEGLRKPAELWILERTTHRALEDLKREVEYRFCQQGDDLNIDPYFRRLQDILSGAGDKWSQQIIQPAQSVTQPIAPNPAQPADQNDKQTT